VLLPSHAEIRFRSETTIERHHRHGIFGGLIEYLSERIAQHCAKYGKQARTIGLRIRYVDHFSAHQTVRISKPTTTSANCSPQQKICFSKLFTAPRGVRLVGRSA